MPTLEITRTVTYEDATSETPYGLTATIQLECSVAQRNLFTLSASQSTLIFETGRSPFATGKVAYVCITNTGASSCYVALVDDVASDGMAHEIPAGASMDFFGSDISISGTDELKYVYAKGNTTIEVDAFQ
jgi:hypothetical protein